jgi:mono/diheme cytochrome c family protein
MSEEFSLDEGFATENWWRRTFVRLMSPELRALLGTLVFFLSIVALGLAAINEPARLGTFEQQYNGRAIERGAVIFTSTCATCHGDNGQGILGKGPALNYESFHNGDRAAAVGWSGTLESYIALTVTSGRPVKSCGLYAEPMPTWGQDYGGPLRPDQVRDVTAFIANWGLDPLPDSSVTRPFTPEECGGVVEPIDVTSIAPEVLAALEEVSALTGDPFRGEGLVNGTGFPVSGEPALGCNGCHIADGTGTGPSYEGLSTRLPHADYVLPDAAVEAGVDPVLYYLVETVWWPGAYFVPGYENVIMPATFKDRMDAQDMADIIAYLLTQ